MASELHGTCALGQDGLKLQKSLIQQQFSLSSNQNFLDLLGFGIEIFTCTQVKDN